MDSQEKIEYWLDLAEYDLGVAKAMQRACKYLYVGFIGDVGMDKKEAISIAKQYANVVAQDIKPDKIVLFGSTVNGSRRDDSDIDVAVIFNKFEGNWIKTSAHIVGLCEGISYDIEPVLCSTSEDRSGFVEEILKTGKILFERP
ncbi:MAG: nucleotidyltransferase domain-containing protein [Holophagales bacterium]|nr:nucleotidyltransferase domain-containing protein [Holophagales bacterium]